MPAAWPREAGAADAEAEELFPRLQDAVRGFRNVSALLEMSLAGCMRGQFQGTRRGGDRRHLGTGSGLLFDGGRDSSRPWGHQL